MTRNYLPLIEVICCIGIYTFALIYAFYQAHLAGNGLTGSNDNKNDQ